jgi:hypothetical protein
VAQAHGGARLPALDPDVVDELDRHRQTHARVGWLGGRAPAAVIGHRDLHDAGRVSSTCTSTVFGPPGRSA